MNCSRHLDQTSCSRWCATPSVARENAVTRKRAALASRVSRALAFPLRDLLAEQRDGSSPRSILDAREGDDAIAYAAQRNGLCPDPQGSFARFGDRFVKVSTSVPAEWIDSFCALLPACVEKARGRNEVSALF